MPSVVHLPSPGRDRANKGARRAVVSSPSLEDVAYDVYRRLDKYIAGSFSAYKRDVAQAFK